MQYLHGNTTVSINYRTGLTHKIRYLYYLYDGDNLFLAEYFKHATIIQVVYNLNKMKKNNF